MVDINQLSQLEHYEERFPWRVLAIFNTYRCFLSLTLLCLYFANVSNFPLGKTIPQLYLSLSIGYVIFSFAVLWPSVRRTIDFYILVCVLIITDIIVLSILMRASLPLTNVFTILVSVSVAAGSIMTAGSISLLFASIGTLIAFFLYGVLGIRHIFDSQGFEIAGVLGGTYFVIAVLGYGLSRRIHTSEILANQRKVELTKLEQLSQYIIQRMQSGVIVVDKYENVRFLNKSAGVLLRYKDGDLVKILSDLPHAVVEQFKAFYGKHSREFSGQVNIQGQNISLQIIPVKEKTDEDDLALIFLEDSDVIAEEAQRLKLASLGRLTASIAHEVRNPLSAINHAAELLKESTYLSEEDIRLTEIIHKQSLRMNKIIENVLQLSKQKKSLPVKINLKRWLENFIHEVTFSDVENPQVKITVESDNIILYFDEEQLKQILHNLCDNGFFFSYENTGKAIVELVAKQDQLTGMVTVDVIDSGKGISEELYQYIFEPFFTTKKKGTGLGLFIARELCEANNAKLSYKIAPSGGCCFRITSFINETKS